jgi:hypothetical protein
MRPIPKLVTCFGTPPGSFSWQLTSLAHHSPPSKSAEDLGITAQSGAYRHGAVSRVTVRSLVGMLASPLFPNETKRAIAELLLRSCDVDMRIPSAERHGFLREVTQASHPHFDDSLPDLIVSINPLAPGRSAATAVQEIIQNYKADHKIPDQRRREDKFEDYLTIWDLPSESFCSQIWKGLPRAACEPKGEKRKGSKPCLSQSMSQLMGQTKSPLRKSQFCQDLGRGVGDKAERSGFEPEMPVSRHTGLAIRRFRPLSHLSENLFLRAIRGFRPSR